MGLRLWARLVKEARVKEPKTKNGMSDRSISFLPKRSESFKGIIGERERVSQGTCYNYKNVNTMVIGGLFQAKKKEMKTSSLF